MRENKFIKLRVPIDTVSYKSLTVNTDRILFITDSVDGGSVIQFDDYDTAVWVSESVEEILELIMKGKQE